MDTPVTFSQADIGRCDVSALFPNITIGGGGDGEGEDGGEDGGEGGEDGDGETTTQRVLSFTVTVTLPTTTTPDVLIPTTLPGPTVVSTMLV